MRSPPDREPTFFCWSLPRKPNQPQYARDGIFCWDGDFYAPGPLRALGLAGGAVRAGFLHYSTLDEVDRLAEALARLRSA